MEALYIICSDTYETGVRILDEQQRTLVSLINTFYFHRNRPARDRMYVMTHTAEAFRSYARINFTTVEKLLRESEYPYLDRYTAAHKKILVAISCANQKACAEEDAVQLLTFMKHYWLEYVLASRKAYMPHLLHYIKNLPASRRQAINTFQGV